MEILNRFLAGHEHVVCTPQWRGGAGHVGDSKPCLKDDWGSGLFISEKHSVDAKASRVHTRLQSGRNLKLHFVGELRAAPHGKYAPAGSRQDCPLTVSPIFGMLIPLSGNWVPAWNIRVLKPTDDESHDAPPPGVICQTVKVALKDFEDFNIELIALLQNPELPIPENEDDTAELARAPSEYELAGQRTRPYKDAEMDLQLRAAKRLLR